MIFREWVTQKLGTDKWVVDHFGDGRFDRALTQAEFTALTVEHENIYGLDAARVAEDYQLRFGKNLCATLLKHGLRA